jgi:hypothetical protein
VGPAAVSSSAGEHSVTESDSKGRMDFTST